VVQLRFVAAGVALFAAELIAQERHASARGDRYLSGSQAVTFGSYAGPHLSYIRDRAVTMVAFHHEYTLVAAWGVTLSHVLEAPLAVLGPPRTDRCTAADHSDTCSRAFQSGGTSVGLGLSPLGLRVSAPGNGRARLFGSVAGGVMLFDRRTPSSRARALNFAGDYVAGVEVDVGRKSAISAGWKFQHWSNGGTASSNPGIDANLLIVSVKRRRQD